jgi:glycosyltransferase involved in cell wall biosynthesis
MDIRVNSEQLGIVIIGRNEGKRLSACLASLAEFNRKNLVYVDSGSNDGSQEALAEFGSICLTLGMSIPFSAARARNKGWQYLKEHNSIIQFIQFIDRDCLLQPSRLQIGLEHLMKSPKTAVVCGRRRELYPTKSIYNRICDEEWNTPRGPSLACGGDALIRLVALEDVNGYKNYFIAGEEPEMCYRMRKKNWEIVRIDEEMTLHDDNIISFTQWWKRANRAGFAFALSAKEHGKDSENFCVHQTLRSLIWTGLLATILLLGLYLPIVLFSLFIFPLQILKVFLKQKKYFFTLAFSYAR